LTLQLFCKFKECLGGKTYQRSYRKLLHTEIKLIDFGLTFNSKLKKTGAVGTWTYLAPEILLGMEKTPAIDLWALGCILLELFTGDSPFSLQMEDPLEP
jgi:serine/threonine protein kinase